ncbi:protein FAR-RED IMPAIRED RESPONSE 1-like [Castanea sativa]|uniref:protein FAR-RED IMPAIRED RESPONSE 1-like n=1 Tax=Castanea sativa TaxID=21020 RepID=UPI003F6522CE
MGIHVPSNVPMESTSFKGMEFEANEIEYDFYNEYGRKAGFSISKDKKYVVNEFIAEHNHYLHLPSTVHMMPSQRKVATTHAIEIDLAHESGLRLKQSYELLCTQANARMIIDYSHFDDVITFDTMYRDARPLGVFLDLNHHRETIVFGGALLYDND